MPVAQYGSLQAFFLRLSQLNPRSVFADTLLK
jgi:hypothetical protein